MYVITMPILKVLKNLKICLNYNNLIVFYILLDIKIGIIYLSILILTIRSKKNLLENIIERNN